MMHRLSFVLLALVTLTRCGGDPAADPSSPAGAPSGDPAVVEAVPAPPEAFEAPAIPSGGDPAQHYLQDDVVLTMQSPYVRNHILVRVAKVLEPAVPPNPTATLWDFNKKERIESQHHHKTRAAKADELVPGVLVAAHWKRDKDGKLIAPANAVDAYQGLWMVARVVNVRSRDEGYVLLAGGLLAPPSALRVLEGDTSPKLSQRGAEDSHYIAEEHMFVAKQGLPSKRHMFVLPALPTKPDAPLGDGGQGKFVHTTDGELVMRPHAWRTRLAIAKDLKAGNYVFAPHLKDGGKNRPPKTRNESLSSLWMVVKIDKPGGKTPGTVTAEGDIEIDVKALRVIAE